MKAIELAKKDGKERVCHLCNDLPTEARKRTFQVPAPLGLTPYQEIGLAITNGFASTGGLGFGLAADLLGMIRAVIFLPSIVGGRSTLPALANFSRTESSTRRPSS